MIVGSLVVVGYGAYYSIDAFFGEPDIPIAIKIATPTIVVGVVLLLLRPQLWQVLYQPPGLGYQGRIGKRNCASSCQT